MEQKCCKFNAYLASPIVIFLYSLVARQKAHYKKR